MAGRPILYCLSIPQKCTSKCNLLSLSDEDNINEINKLYSGLSGPFTLLSRLNVKLRGGGGGGYQIANEAKRGQGGRLYAPLQFLL